MPWGVRSEGVCSMDAAIEPPRMDSRRPSGRTDRGKDSLCKCHSTLIPYYCLLCPGRLASVPLRHTIASLGAWLCSTPTNARRRVGSACICPSLATELRSFATPAIRPRTSTPSGDYAPSLRSPWRAAEEVTLQSLPHYGSEDIGNEWLARPPVGAR